MLLSAAAFPPPPAWRPPGPPQLPWRSRCRQTLTWPRRQPLPPQLGGCPEHRMVHPDQAPRAALAEQLRQVWRWQPVHRAGLRRAPTVCTPHRGSGTRMVRNPTWAGLLHQGLY